MRVEGSVGGELEKNTPGHDSPVVIMEEILSGICVRMGLCRGGLCLGFGRRRDRVGEERM